MGKKETQGMIKSITGQVNFAFFRAMAARMDFSFDRYGHFERNYKGEYSEEFLKDVARTLRRLVVKWKYKGTTAKGNAVIFLLERILFYVDGGFTKAGRRVERGNTEFLIDAANAGHIEYTCPQVPGATFDNGDSAGSPGFCGFSEREVEDFKKRGDD